MDLHRIIAGNIANRWRIMRINVELYIMEYYVREK